MWPLSGPTTRAKKSEERDFQTTPPRSRPKSEQPVQRAAFALAQEPPMSDPEKAPARLSSAPLLRNEVGLTTLEYVILSILLAALAMAAWQQFGARRESAVPDAAPPLDSPAGDAPSASDR
jgi:hypothetical protein